MNNHQRSKEISIYFLNAEKFSTWENKKRTLTAENIKQICDKNNWIKADYKKIEELQEKIKELLLEKHF